MSPTQMWKVTPGSPEEIHAPDAIITPTAPFVCEGGANEESCSDEEFSATEANSDEERFDATSRLTNSRGAVDGEGDMRLFQSPRKKVHRGKPGHASETRCGKPTRNYLLLASGEDSVEIEFHCKTCHGMISSRMSKSEQSSELKNPLEASG